MSASGSACKLLPEPPPDIAAVQIGHVWLDECEVERNDAFLGDFDLISYGLDTSTEVRGQESDTAVAVVRVGVVWDHREGGALPFHKLSVHVAGMFNWSPEQLEQDSISGWLKFYGTYLLWPYARTYIATLSTLAGLPALQIMTVNVPEPNLGQPISDSDAVRSFGAS